MYLSFRSAASLVIDSEIGCGQQERFTCFKHNYNFPVHAARYCLKEGGLSANNHSTKVGPPEFCKWNLRNRLNEKPVAAV